MFRMRMLRDLSADQKLTRQRSIGVIQEVSQAYVTTQLPYLFSLIPLFSLVMLNLLLTSPEPTYVYVARAI